MSSDQGGKIEGEVTRIEAVRYLQGAVGHATGSLLFLLAGGVLVVTGHPVFGWTLVAGAFLLSANGFSIWAWDRLRESFAAGARTTENESTRTLRARPLSGESRVEMMAGAVMVLSLFVLLVVLSLAVQLVDHTLVAVACVATLAGGNVAALVRAYRESERRR